MLFTKLVGCQLTEFNSEGFSVKDRNGNIKNFVFFKDEGDCCGFNDLKNELFISTDELARNPVITKVEEIDASDSKYDDCDHVIVTFFGEVKKLAQIDSLSSSGSGWSYGASVTVKCIETGEEKTITSW